MNRALKRWKWPTTMAVCLVAGAVLATWAGRQPVRISVDVPDEAGEVKAGWRGGESIFEAVDEAFAPHFMDVTITAAGKAGESHRGGFQMVAMAAIDSVTFGDPGQWAHASTYFLLHGDKRPETLRLTGWNTGPGAYFSFETDMHSEAVEVQPAGAASERVELNTERRSQLRHAVGPGRRYHRYVGQVPRRALGDLRIELAAGPAREITRLYVGTWLPRIYYGGAQPARPPAGIRKSHWEPAWEGGGFHLHSSHFPGASFALTTLGFGLLLLGSVASLAWVLPRLYRDFEQRLQCKPEGGVAPPFPQGIFWRFLGPVLALWLYFFLVFYPGTMNTDALIQWRQMLKMSFDPEHPPIYALVMGAGKWLWDSPAPVALAQVVAGAALVAAAAAWLWGAGLRRWLVLSLYAAMALSPRNMTMMISLIKDTPYALTMLGMTLALASLCRRPGGGVDIRWAVLGAALGAATVLRHNGTLMAAATLPLLLYFFPRQWRGIALCVALTLTIHLGVREGVYRIIHIDPGQGGLHDFTTAHLAILMDRDVPLYNDEYEFLDQVRDFEDRWGYDPRRVSSTSQPHLEVYHRAWAREHGAAYWALYKDIAGRNFLNACVYFIERGGFLYIPWDTGGEMETYFLGITSNELGLYNFDIFLEAPDRIRSLLAWTGTPAWNWLFWRPALLLFVVIGAALIAWRHQGDPRWLVVYAPVLANTGTIAVAAISQAARYQFPLTFASAFLVGVALLPRKRAKSPERPPGDGGAAT